MVYLGKVYLSIFILFIGSATGNGQECERGAHMSREILNYRGKLWVLEGSTVARHSKQVLIRGLLWQIVMMPVFDADSNKPVSLGIHVNGKWAVVVAFIMIISRIFETVVIHF